MSKEASCRPALPPIAAVVRSPTSATTSPTTIAVASAVPVLMTARRCIWTRRVCRTTADRRRRSRSRGIARRSILFRSPIAPISIADAGYTDHRPARLSAARSRQSRLLRRRRIRIADDADRDLGDRRKAADSPFEHSKRKSAQHGVYLHRECSRRATRPTMRSTASMSISTRPAVVPTLGDDALELVLGAVGGTHGQPPDLRNYLLGGAARDPLGQDGRAADAGGARVR